MGESIMAASTDEHRMGESVASGRRLEVSVSFGRFENDLLSWEKWSSFSQNKYLEEVEKCATPGSVAQKKAYFEAHYRRIASRKAEQLEQKTVEAESPRQDHENARVSAGFGEHSGFDVSNGEDARGSEQETELDGGDENELKEDTERVEIPAEIIENAVESVESPHKLAKEAEKVPSFKEELMKSATQKESRKVSPSIKVREMAKIRKKPASPVAKSPQVSATKISKTVMSSNPTRNTSGSPQSKNRISIGGTKKVSPKALHMSINIDTPSPDPAPPESAPLATRKLFIMEKMKDKEIVKRAFKTFENGFNHLRSSVEESSLASKQVSTKGSENKVSSSIAPRKENAGSLKAVNVDKKAAKTTPSFGLKSYGRAEKINEKLPDKPKGKPSESTPLPAKLKEEKDSDTRKSRFGLTLRSTGFYQAQKVFRSPLDKEGSKTLGI